MMAKGVNERFNARENKRVSSFVFSCKPYAYAFSHHFNISLPPLAVPGSNFCYF